jgi:hypothetical protein
MMVCAKCGAGGGRVEKALHDDYMRSNQQEYYTMATK